MPVMPSIHVTSYTMTQNMLKGTLNLESCGIKESCVLLDSGKG